MPYGHLGVLSHRVHFNRGSRACRYVVYVHGSVAALCRDILIERVPCYSLHEVTMFRDFTDTLGIMRTKNSCSVIGTASNDVVTSRRPSEVVDLHCCTAKGSSRLPVLFLVLMFVCIRTEIVHRRRTRRRPDNNHPICKSYLACVDERSHNNAKRSEVIMLNEVVVYIAGKKYIG